MHKMIQNDDKASNQMLSASPTSEVRCIYIYIYIVMHKMIQNDDKASNQMLSAVSGVYPPPWHGYIILYRDQNVRARNCTAARWRD